MDEVKKWAVGDSPKIWSWGSQRYPFKSRSRMSVGNKHVNLLIITSHTATSGHLSGPHMIYILSKPREYVIRLDIFLVNSKLVDEWVATIESWCCSGKTQDAHGHYVDEPSHLTVKCELIGPVGQAHPSWREPLTRRDSVQHPLDFSLLRALQHADLIGLMVKYRYRHHSSVISSDIGFVERLMTTGELMIFQKNSDCPRALWVRLTLPSRLTFKIGRIERATLLLVNWGRTSTPASQSCEATSTFLSFEHFSMLTSLPLWTQYLDRHNSSKIDDIKYQLCWYTGVNGSKP